MIISTSNTLYNPVHKTFTCEISEINVKNEIFHRLYEDACDIGITLISHLTQAESTYYLAEDETKYSDEGELLFYVLYPTTETVRKFPNLKDSKLIIFND